jgi:NAD(P)-dependent dehydrogenase (short-subunit alcohol dehydrogenase family)
MASQKKLSGRVAIVTGASKGIGLGIAKAFAAHGAKLILASRGPEVENVAEALRETGADAVAMRCDVSDPSACESLAQFAFDEYGSIDVLDCNAGVCELRSFLDGNDDWRDFHLDVNVKGVWNCCKAVLPHMVDQGKGSIVITSSVTGIMVSDPGEVAYATSKAALVGFTKALARETASSGVRVNCICPGCVRTPMLESMAGDSPDESESALAAVAAAIPMGRLADPYECGELCAFLASDEASYITGEHVVIDGGSTLPETVAFGQ